MGVDNIKLSVESNCSSKDCNDNADRAYSSDVVCNRVRVLKIWNNSWWRWQPPDHRRLN